MATALGIAAIWESSLASLLPPPPASSISTSSPAAPPTNVDKAELRETTRAWHVATAFLAPRVLEESTLELQPSEDVVQAVNRLGAVGMIAELLDWHTDQVTLAFDAILVQELATYLDEPEEPDVRSVLIRFATYLQIWSQPHEALSAAIPPAASSSSTPPLPLVQKFRQHFLHLLYPRLTGPAFYGGLRAFYGVTRTWFDADAGQPEEADAEERATDMNVIRAIHYLSLLERLEPLLLSVAYTAIEERIKDKLAGDFETEGQLDALAEWLSNDVGQWLIAIYSLAYENASAEDAAAQAAAEEYARRKAVSVLRPAMQRFEWHVYNQVLALRISELFDIIVDYPASLPAIRDLKTCLDKTDQKAQLVKSLTRQVKKRLLHPGANTKDIITQYISLIRVLRVLDPPGVLLARVAGGIRAYLRGRSDTIRCIVSGMIEDDSELMRELLGAGDDGHDATRAGEVRGLLTEKQEDLIESFVDENYTWTPAPIDAPADYSRNRAADIIQLLVSIYDTKELFIKELQTLLAGRLLAIKAYAYDKELRSVETLKVRFGEQALQGLEVMLKDCADSKRTDTALHGVAPISASPLHSTIISHLFWPEYKKSSLRLPGQLGRLTSAYEASYRKHKPGKKLTWLPTMGSVTMEIQLRDRTVEVETDPLKASVLELFSEQPERSVLDLQEALRMAEAGPVRAALQFWAQKGVLACTVSTDTSADAQTWMILERVPVPAAVADAGSSQQHLPLHASGSVLAHGAEAATAGFTAERAQASRAAMQQHWPFIQNALSNLHSLPAVRLQNMLNAMVVSYAGHTLSELEAFLDAAKAEGVVTKGKDGLWRLAPSR